MIRNSFAFILFVLIGVGAAVDGQTPEPKGEVRAFSFSFDGGGYLGVQTEEVTKGNLAKFGLREVKGVGVESVIEGSPAQSAGIQKGDVLVKVNGEDVTSTRKLTRLIGEISPDHQARIIVLRNGTEREITVTVGKRQGIKFDEGSFAPLAPMSRLEFPQMPNLERLPRFEGTLPPGAPDAPFAFALGTRRQIGAGLTPLTKQLAEHFGVDGGALINNVRENSPAAKAGLKAGDIIVEADGKAVKGDFDLIRAIGEKKEGSVTLTIVRDRNRQTISVTPEEMKGGFNEYFEFSTPDAPDSPAAPGVLKLARPATPLVPAVPLNNLLVPGRVI
ncbi:MAG: PDZ domain-containing protein [Acidobacteria bacterium]|nr:PDZ domain-containing protein [Acidobacteriota bacterium]